MNIDNLHIRQSNSVRKLHDRINCLRPVKRMGECKVRFLTVDVKDNTNRSLQIAQEFIENKRNVILNRYKRLILICKQYNLQTIIETIEPLVKIIPTANKSDLGSLASGERNVITLLRKSGIKTHYYILKNNELTHR